VEKNKDQLLLTNPCDKVATELSWQRFMSKVANFQIPHLHVTYPTCIWNLRWGWSHLSSAEIFGIGKLESLGYRVVLFTRSCLAASVEHWLVTD